MHHKPSGMTAFASAATELLQLKDTSKKRKLVTPEASPTAVTMEPAATSTTQVQHKGSEDVAAKKRLQYKMYQRRHRARQQEKARLLEQQVAQLTQEIASLEKTRTEALHGDVDNPRGPADPRFPIWHTLAGSPAQLVREYLKVFEHGFSPQKNAAQLARVRAMMSRDVRGHHFSGADALFEQWRLYSQVFAAVHLTSQGLTVEPLGQQQTVVTAKITLRLRMRRVGLLSLFPSISRRDGVLDKLVGNSLIVDGSLRFIVDPANQVCWLSAEMDFATALTRLTGSFPTTCLCLEDARLDVGTGHIKTSGRMTGQAATEKEVSAAISRLDLSFILSES